MSVLSLCDQVDLWRSAGRRAWPCLDGRVSERKRWDTTRVCWTRAVPRSPFRDLPAETANRSTTTQIYEGTNQIQRMVMARQLLKG
jgi:hypothetical protein